MAKHRIKDHAGNWFIVEKAKPGTYTITNSNLPFQRRFTLCIDVKNHQVEDLVDLDHSSESKTCFGLSEHVQLRNVEVDFTLGQALITAPNLVAIRSAFAWLTFRWFENNEP